MISTIEEIRSFSLHAFSGSRGSHGWDHTVRVNRLCLHIGKMEQADMDVLEIASYLHDVGRQLQDESNGSLCHAERGAHIAENLLKDFPLKQEQKSNIIHSIISHRYRGNRVPESIEAKILFDADKLDSIGAIGLARAFQFAGEIGAKLHNLDVNLEDTQAYSEEDTGYREFKLKLSKIKDRMFTKEGRRIAIKRHEFMELYFEHFLNEYECRE